MKAVLTLIIAAAVAPGALMITDYCVVVAHRGASRDAPENTIPAFELAWEQGADAVEADFRQAACGSIVCIHDATTGRCWDGDLEVSATGLDALQGLKPPENWHAQYPDVTIPTLADVLAVVPPGKKIYIEIKTDESIVPQILADVSSSALYYRQVVFISFSTAALRAVEQTEPATKTLWLCWLESGRNGQANPSLSSVLGTLHEIGADGVSTNSAATDRAFVAGVTAAGYEHHVWTVNDVATATQFIEWGSTSVTSDYPDILDSMRD